MKYTKDKEKEYYNHKLIKETLKDEIKEPHKFDWKEYVLLFFVLLLGFIVTNIIGIDQLISNKFLRFTAEVFILFFAIALVNAIALGLKKLMTGK
jgi:hypothetical protein